MIPAGFEPTACRLGGDRSILLSYGTSFSNVHILQGFRGFGDCSPWCLGVVFANQEGRFLIGFSNFGGRIFSHLLILTLWIRGVGLIPFLGHFRTLFPFSVSGKAVVGLLLRRRSLYPAELRRHAPWPFGHSYLILSHTAQELSTVLAQKYRKAAGMSISARLCTRMRAARSRMARSGSRDRGRSFSAHCAQPHFVTNIRLALSGVARATRRPSIISCLPVALPSMAPVWASSRAYRAVSSRPRS